ncbi:helix-turn-helix domain-containing protein [Streptomyces violaceus]|uniref:helix-turn-helix domain-containing protein n=1 Tax=Streptomyces violaceus TaxID=1936 RepID=UPI0037F6F458
MTERAGADALPGGDGGAAVGLGDAWESGDGGAGRRPEDEAGKGVVCAFGKNLKTLRLREGMDREEFGRRIGYSAATVASYEQGRRIPSPRTIDRADEVLGAGGLLSVWKEEVERAQYPGFFQGMAALEKECIELLMYDTLVINGLLQSEEFTVVTRTDGKKFVYAEAQGTSALETDPKQAALSAARYGIIRSQALTPRESLEFVEGLLGSL